MTTGLKIDVATLAKQCTGLLVTTLAQKVAQVDLSVKVIGATAC